MMRSLRLRLSVLLILAVSATLAAFGYYGHRELVDELYQAFARESRSRSRSSARGTE